MPHGNTDDAIATSFLGSLKTTYGPARIQKQLLSQLRWELSGYLASHILQGLMSCLVSG